MFRFDRRFSLARFHYKVAPYEIWTNPVVISVVGYPYFKLTKWKKNEQRVA